VSDVADDSHTGVVWRSRQIWQNGAAHLRSDERSRQHARWTGGRAFGLVFFPATTVHRWCGRGRRL